MSSSLAQHDGAPTLGLRALEQPEASALMYVGGAQHPDLQLAARSADILLIEVVANTQTVAANQLEQAGKVQVHHTGPSPFFNSDIDLVLRSNGIKTLYLYGPEPSALPLAYDAKRQGYQVVMVQSSEQPPEVFGLRLPTLSSTDLLGRLAATPAGPRNWHEDIKAQRLARPFNERIEPARTALILIDVLNDFCLDKGVIAQTKVSMGRVTATLPRIQNVLESARAAGVSVLHVQAIYGPMFRSQGSPYRFPSQQTREGAVWCASAADLEADAPRFDASLVEVCKEGSWGADFVDGLGPVQGETVIRKHRYSAYLDTALNAELRRRGIETVVLAGVTTNCCVESTARDLAMSDYDTVVLEDCVAVKDLVQHLHEASLEQIRTYFGVVTQSERVLQAWQ